MEHEYWNYIVGILTGTLYTGKMAFAERPSRVADSWREPPARPAVLPPGMGSFDCVRLAPHFAQDDKSVLREVP
jgi:hypothetical protein